MCCLGQSNGEEFWGKNRKVRQIAFVSPKAQIKKDGGHGLDEHQFTACASEKLEQTC